MRHSGGHLLLLRLQLGYGRLFRLSLLIQCIELVTCLALTAVERGEFLRTLRYLPLQLGRLSPQRIGGRALARLIIRGGWRRWRL